jgi:archaeosine synthase
MYMEIEILDQEGFASVKELRFRSNDDAECFTTPAAVFVPFLWNGKRMNDDESINNIFEKIYSLFPIANISGIAHHNFNDQDFKLFLSCDDAPVGEPFAPPKTLFCQPTGFLYPPELAQNDTKGGDIAYFQMRDSEKSPVNGPGVVAPTHLSHIYGKPRQIIELVRRLRTQYKEENLFYAPGIADPYRLPYLVYLGFDLFDTVKAARDSSSLIYWDTLASRQLSDITGQDLDACKCGGCIKLNEILNNAGSFGKLPNLSGDVMYTTLASYLYVHNCLRLANAVRETGEIIKNKNLYSYAYSHSIHSPPAAAALRFFHCELASDLVKVSPRVSSHTIIVGQSEMIHLPDIFSYASRLKETYVPPKRDILLLLPCSFKKPYSRSKTHRIIRRVIDSHPLRWNLHCVVVTSPLGIVPIELDNSYPAKNYDIPVTGDWDTGERLRVDELLVRLIERGTYEHVIGYLGKENYIISDNLEKYFPDRYLIDEEPTSPEALNRLNDILNSIMENANLVPNNKKRTRSGIPFKTRDAWGVLTFQFDADIAERLLKDSNLKGRWPMYSLVDGETGGQIAKYIPERGMFSLGKGAAKRLSGISSNRVFIEDFHPKGTIFCVGISGADTNIRPLDEVLVYHGDDLRAIGRALVTGDAMSQRTRGQGVKVRHRISMRV